MNTAIVPQIVMSVVKAYPQVFPLLNQDARDALKAAAGYDGIRNAYFGAIFDAVYDYLTNDRPVTSFRASMQRAMVQAFGDTVDIAYVDGGGDLPLDDETLDWYNSQVSAEMGFIEELFSRLREDWEGIDPATEAEARATGYVRRLDSIYAEAKMRGSENATLEFGGPSGKESCKDCQRLMGKRHRIKYILEHDLIPHPGNTNFECGGWQCEHRWFNPKTGEEYKSFKDLEAVLKSNQRKD
jgi:hypothetical protein